MYYYNLMENNPQATPEEPTNVVQLHFKQPDSAMARDYLQARFNHPSVRGRAMNQERANHLREQAAERFGIELELVPEVSTSSTGEAVEHESREEPSYLKSNRQS